MMANPDLCRHLLATSSRSVSSLLDGTGLAPVLAHRLCRWPIVLPPLRDRLSDLGPLAHAFVARHLGQSKGRSLSVHNLGRHRSEMCTSAVPPAPPHPRPFHAHEFPHAVSTDFGGYPLPPPTAISHPVLPRGRHARIRPGTPHSPTVVGKLHPVSVDP